MENTNEKTHADEMLNEYNRTAEYHNYIAYQHTMLYIEKYSPIKVTVVNDENSLITYVMQIYNVAITNLKSYVASGEKPTIPERNYFKYIYLLVKYYVGVYLDHSFHRRMVNQFKELTDSCYK